MVSSAPANRCSGWGPSYSNAPWVSVTARIRAMNSSRTLGKHLSYITKVWGRISTQLVTPVDVCIAKMKGLDLAEVQGGGSDTRHKCSQFILYPLFLEKNKAKRIQNGGAASLPYPHATGLTGCWEVSSACRKNWGTSPSSAISKDSGTTRGKVWALLQNKKISFQE